MKTKKGVFLSARPLISSIRSSLPRCSSVESYSSGCSSYLFWVCCFTVILARDQMPSGRTPLLSSWSQGALKRLSLVPLLSFRDRVHLSQPFPCLEHVILLNETFCISIFDFKYRCCFFSVASFFNQAQLGKDILWYVVMCDQGVCR